MAEWVHLLTVPGNPVKLGTLVRLGVALGWDVDDMAVSQHYQDVVLWRRKDATAVRPPVFVLTGGEADDAGGTAAEAVQREAMRQLVATPPVPEPPMLDPPHEATEPSVAEQMAADPDALPLTRFCRLCGREMVSKEKARDHEQDHQRPEAQACTVEGCGWVFLTDKGMAHHVTMKHPEVAQDLGPISRVPFDADQARAAAAGSL